MTDAKIDLNFDAPCSPGIRAIKANAIAAYSRIAPRIVEMRQAGLTLAQIAASLNEAGQVTRKGSKFYGDTVRRILQRIESHHD